MTTQRNLPSLLPALAAAGLVAILAAAAWVAARRAGTALPPGAWAVTRMEGAPRTERAVLSGEAALAAGEWIETDAGSRAQLSAGGSGRIQVLPGARLRLLESGPSGSRLQLQRGGIEAQLSGRAPVRVETGAALVELARSCALRVDEVGAGEVRVMAGRATLVWKGDATLVPAGARCPFRPLTGPAAPWFEDAPARFAESLAGYFASRDDTTARIAALDAVLEAARPRDAVTLWHLLGLVEPGDRARVHDRLARLAPPPAGVTREAALRGDRAGLELWREALPGVAGPR